MATKEKTLRGGQSFVLVSGAIAAVVVSGRRVLATKAAWLAVSTSSSCYKQWQYNPVNELLRYQGHTRGLLFLFCLAALPLTMTPNKD